MALHINVSRVDDEIVKRELEKVDQVMCNPRSMELEFPCPPNIYDMVHFQPNKLSYSQRGTICHLHTI